MRHRLGWLPAPAALTLLLVLLVGWPALTWGAGSDTDDGDEPMTIEHYQAEFTIDDNGTLTAVERIRVRVPVHQSWIIRHFDHHDPVVPGARRVPRDIEARLTEAHPNADGLKAIQRRIQSQSERTREVDHEPVYADPDRSAEFYEGQVQHYTERAEMYEGFRVRTKASVRQSEEHVARYPGIEEFSDILASTRERLAGYEADVDRAQALVAHYEELVARARAGTLDPVQNYLEWNMLGPSAGANRVMTTLEESGRVTAVLIGNHVVGMPPGSYTYEIRYAFDDALLPSARGATTSRFRWHLIPGGWPQPIASAHLTVNLPGAASKVQCEIGAAAHTCGEVAGEGTGTLVVHASGIPPRTPVTVTGDIAVVPPSNSLLPWSARWDRVLGTDPPRLGWVLALAALAFLAGLLIVRWARERHPTPALQLTPPDDIGPAQTSYLLTKHVPDSALEMSVMQAAARGALRVEARGSQWSITRTPEYDALLQHMDPVTQAAAKAIPARGLHFGPSSAQAGKVLAEGRAAVQKATRSWALTDKYVGRRWWMFPVLGAVVVAAGTVLWALVHEPMQMRAVALVPGMFAIAAVPLFKPAARKRRTAKGRELWAQMLGFRARMAGTAPDTAELAGDGAEELAGYLPYAMAFELTAPFAASWSEVAGSGHLPPYLVHTGRASRTPSLDAVTDRLAADVGSAVASYASSRRS
ncbi:DUF2207 domain-containing protein [Nocardioides limicola]|uniref:DUF2207 domain-containing protein n=1 Tax=Nocardioides limicola TaxID=2803368 RepID=UPI00193C084E|nr:DUF2207 domain-containing protein [Nocardioides sp. DJM-14]